MNILNFLEEISITPNYNNRVNDLIAAQELDIKNAYKTNNSVVIKKKFNGFNDSLNPSDVACITQ